MIDIYKFKNLAKARFFYKFLFKNHIFDKWLKNVRGQHGRDSSRGIPQYEENHDILQLLDTCKDIDYSFYWADTPEGNGYWSNLHSKFWLEYRSFKNDLITIGHFNC